jgi:hypothetical protein
MIIHEILIIDIEVYVRENKEIPRGHHYLIMIDRQKFKVEQESLTGSEILKLAGKTPVERFQLNQRFKGGKVIKVDYDKTVSFVEPGVEKFMTIPLDQTEGGK